MYDGPEEVKTVGCSESDDNFTESFVRLDEVREVLPLFECVWDSQVNSEASTPYSDHVAKPEENHSECVNPLRALWPIAKRTDGDHKDEGDVKLQEDFENGGTCTLI